MQIDNRNFLIVSKHMRLKRLWQFFFTGWGLIMVAALVSGSLFTKQLLWSPISAINMKEITSNQFRMTNAAFSGTDKTGEPFTINVANAFQEWKEPDIIHMQKVSGTIIRIAEGKKIKDNITSNVAEYNRKTRKVILSGNVHVNSSNGDKILTDELVIQL